MRYPEDVIEEVRTRNDIVDVVGQYVHIERKGKDYSGLCPFHHEKTASFYVIPAKQMYYCFGCGAGGNVFKFVMDYENYTFVEAVQMLAERAGIDLPTAEPTEAERREANRKSELLAIQKEAAVYFYRMLYTPAGKHGLDYLHERKLTDDTIRRFGLGFSPTTSGGMYRYLKQKGFSDERIRESGLVRMDEKRVSDIFWNRVMFPIMDINNHVIGFGGRVMGDAKPKYLNSQESPIFDKRRNLFGLNEARKSRERYMLLCEGYMDVISMHQAGFTNSVASLGTAFTSEQSLLLKRYCDEVILTYDSDGAGVKAALRAIPILKQAGLPAKVLNMRPYKDPDEFIKALGPDEFRKRIEQADNSFLYEIEQLKKNYQLEDPQEQTAFYHAIADKLLGFTEELERNSYLEAVCRRFMIQADAMRRLVNQRGAAGYGAEALDYRAANNRRKDVYDPSARETKTVKAEPEAQEPEPYYDPGDSYDGDEPYYEPGMFDMAEPAGTSVQASRPEQTEAAAQSNRGRAEQRPAGGVRKQKTDPAKAAANHAQKLLLTWVGEEPEVYSIIKRYITPADFTVDLYRRMAEKLFAQAEHGKAEPAMILSGFLDGDEAEEASSVFQTKLADELSGKERSQAFRDIVTRVKRNSLDERSRRAVTMQELQSIAAEKKAFGSVRIELPE